MSVRGQWLVQGQTGKIWQSLKPYINSTYINSMSITSTYISSIIIYSHFINEGTEAPRSSLGFQIPLITPQTGFGGAAS